LKTGYPSKLAVALLACLWCFAQVARSAQPSFEKDVVVVDFSDETTATLGRPWNRSYLAAITDKLFEAKARAVVLKMFMDTPSKDEAVDARLEQAMKGGRVILQAALSDDPPVSSNMLERFEYRGSLQGVKVQVSGKVGWMPITRFQEASARVCFADAQVATSAPVVEEMNGKLYKSLNTCIVEEATGATLTDVGPRFAAIGPWRLPVDPGASVVVPLTDISMPAHLRAEDVMLGRVSREKLEGKIAVVSYSGSKSPTFPIGDKQVKVHQAFVAILRDYFAAIQPAAANEASSK
jgi:hypothetical protein